MSNIAVILSGGTGSRMGGDIPKQYLEVGGQPIIAYSIRKFLESDAISYVIIAIADSWIPFVRESLIPQNSEKTILFAPAGQTRQLSIFNALRVARDNGAEDGDYVIIHDAARPLVSPELIGNCLRENLECDGVLPVLPMKDTIYQSHDGLVVDQLLDRSVLYAGQAPESFVFGKYYNAHQNMTLDELMQISGSTQLAIKAGLKIHLIPGEELNFKITTPGDLVRFQTFLNSKTR